MLHTACINNTEEGTSDSGDQVQTTTERSPTQSELPLTVYCVNMYLLLL